MHVWCSSRPFSSTRTISRAVHGTEIAFLDGVDGSDRCAGDLWTLDSGTAQDRWGGPASRRVGASETAARELPQILRTNCGQTRTNADKVQQPLPTYLPTYLRLAAVS